MTIRAKLKCHFPKGESQTNFKIDAFKKQRLRITQLEKVRFIKVNELKLTRVELFSFFTLCGAAHASELFCTARLTHDERFLYHSNLSF